MPRDFITQPTNLLLITLVVISGGALLSPFLSRSGAREVNPGEATLLINREDAQVIDVRIKRADLPDGTPLESAFQRMRTAREQEASTILAQGQKNAQIIRATADAEAARIYANSFGKDPQFYDFYRAMQSYDTTFAKGGADSSIILSPDNDYLRQFRGGGR